MKTIKALFLLATLSLSTLYGSFAEEYEKALELRSQNREVQAAVLMIPYVSTNVLAAKLYEDVTLSRAAYYLKNEEFEVAKNILKPMLKASSKVRALYSETLYAQNMKDAEIELEEKRELEALELFEKACSFKYSQSCLEPSMKIAYKLNDYNRSSHLSQEVYHINKSQNSVVIAYESALKMGDEPRATFWKRLIKKEEPKKVAIVPVKQELPQEKEDAPLTRVSSLAAGVKYQMRMAQSGNYDYSTVSAPIDFEMYDKEDRRRYVKADVLYLNDKLYNDEDSVQGTSTDTAFSMAIGIEYPYMTLEVGITPVGVTIDPTLTALLSFKTSNESLNLNATFLRESIDNSLLSYIGYSEEESQQWGRVLKNGLEVGLSYESDISYFFDMGYYPSIKGKNIIDNSELKAVAQAIYHTNMNSSIQVDYGVKMQYDMYDNNSHRFTYGYGGYFSPQSYYAGNAGVDVTNSSDSRYYWKLNASLGFESYEVDGIKASSVFNPFGSVDAYSEDDLTYLFSYGAGMRFNENIDFIFDARFEREREYHIAGLGLKFVYFFDKKDKGTLYNYHNGYRVDSRLK